jgi:hypothetical protein
MTFIQAYMQALDLEYTAAPAVTDIEAKDMIGYCISEDKKYKGKMTVTSAMARACETVGIPATFEAINARIQQDQQQQEEQIK